MIVDYTVLKNHSVKSGSRILGVKGDHLTNVLKVSLGDCGYDFDKVEVRFTMPYMEDDTIVKLPVDAKSQVAIYPIPYKLFLNSGTVGITVTAHTSDGEAFSSLTAEYVILDCDFSTEEIKARFEGAILGTAKLNTMILGLG